MITRKDFEAISNWIEPNTSVLDLGCGDGSLLVNLQETRNIIGYGIENDDAGILQCVANGVNVIQSNLESAEFHRAPTFRRCSSAWPAREPKGLCPGRGGIPRRHQ